MYLILSYLVIQGEGDFKRLGEGEEFLHIDVYFTRPSGSDLDHWSGEYCVVNKRHLGNTSQLGYESSLGGLWKHPLRNV